MHRFLALALFALAPALARAETFPIPADDPVATVNIPEKWEPKSYDGGVEATSPDGKVYIAVEMVEADGVKDAVKEGIEFFDKQGVEIDVDSMKTTESTGPAGKSWEIGFSGKDKEGPTAVYMTLMTTNKKDKLAMLYFWGAPKDADANSEALKAIADTFQFTK